MAASIDFNDIKLVAVSDCIPIFSAVFISNLHYCPFQVIGEGTYGKVYHAKCHNQDRAVKKIYAKVSQAEMEREYKQLGRANHTNIIFLYGVSFHDDVHYMVMEYAEGGSIAYLLHKNSKPDYTFEHFINWALHSAMVLFIEVESTDIYLLSTNM